ncbi:MAG: CoA-binding protein [Candidatus Moranbacteria bacterium]|nr:CoA-binding protein [Candidatus Moranbacteria bacterium]
MKRSPLDSLFSPKSVALVGASARIGSVGNDIAKNLVYGGYPGKVFLVNPNADELYGVRCHPDLASLKAVPDLVIIAVPAASVPEILRQSADIGSPAAVVVSAGFRETGPDGLALEREIADIAKESGIALLGPNCLGFLHPAIGLNASFASRLPKRGSIGLLSQSGALMTAILDLTDGRVGFSKFVSTGNKTVLDEKTLIKYLSEDPDTRVIAMYSEDLSDAASFVTLGRATLAKREPKPIIVLKSGQTESGKRASGSHTGSLAGSDSSYDALFRQAHVIRAESIRDFIDTAAAFSENPLPPGRRVAIVTNAGGLGVVAADAATRAGLDILPLSERSAASLRPHLPSAASVGNPIDLLGDARSDRYRIALDVVGKDDGIDAILVILTPQSMTEAEETAHEIVRTKRLSGKPVIAVFAGGRAVEQGVTVLREGGVTVFTYPEDATRTLGHLAQAGAWHLRHVSGKRRLGNIDTSRAESVFRAVARESRYALTQSEVFEVLGAYGFPLLRSELATEPSQAASIARTFGRSVALKISSSDISHKTDVGGVSLDVPPEDVASEFGRLMARVRSHRPNAHLDGVTVMEMASPGGKEIILGAKREPGLGTVILVGMGGIYTEAIRDAASRFAPVTHEDGKEMLSELRSFPILSGIRGERAVDLDVLTDCIVRLSRLVEDFPQIAELDINPLSVYPDGSLSHALDGRIIVS